MIYTPLNIKTDYSLLDSMIKIDDLIKFATKNNIKSLSIADDNLCGVIEFYKKCRQNNIKPIIGLSIKNIVLYAKNNNGYKNLLKINTFIQNKKLSIDILNKYSDDIICILPNNKLKDKLKFKDIFITYNDSEGQSGDNLIYANEILYLEKEDYKYFKYLKQIKGEETNKSDNYLKLDLNCDLTNNYKIYDMCNVELTFNNNLIPIYDTNIDSYEYLKKLCIEGLKRIFGDVVGSKYKERLKYELSVIKNMNFCDYFLIVADYVRFAKEHNILVGPGRGSASSSLVSYLLNIIEIDPLKYDLLFERFLNKDRITMPDIDIDFDGERIDEVIDYCKSKYGIKNVASIITYSSLTTKQVLKDVGKVLNIDEEEVNYFSKMFKAKKSLQDNYNESDQIKNHLIKNPELKELFDISIKLENIKKHSSIHASGVVISKCSIDDIMPLVNYKDSYLTGYQAEYLEELGFIKMDFLSLKTLTTINELISKTNIDFNNIPLNDSNTLDIFKYGNTLGIFQFESLGMISFLKKLRPNSFEDLCAAIALYRPGPIDNIDTYIKRKNGLEKYDCYDESLENILKPTYGIIIYQEQIMQIAHTMASYTLGEADILRRAMSKKKSNILKNEKDKFITRSIQNGYKEDIAIKIYDLILKFAEYGFNKAHAVAYSLISYKMAYIKANYKEVFMSHLLNESIGSKIDLIDRINNAKDNNIIILKPNINKSTSQFEIIDNCILYPLSGISIMAINNILVNREQPYKDIFDFLRKVDLKIISKESIKNLIYTGAFDEFENRKTLIENLDVIYNYAELNDYDLEPPVLMHYDEYTPKEIMNLEYNVFGLYLNNHPVLEYRKKYNKPISINSITRYLNKRITIISRVDDIKEISTKNNDKMCFIKISDEHGKLDCTLFDSNHFDINVGDIIMIYGRVNRRKGNDQIVINDIKKIDN